MWLSEKHQYTLVITNTRGPFEFVCIICIALLGELTLYSLTDNPPYLCSY